MSDASRFAGAFLAGADFLEGAFFEAGFACPKGAAAFSGCGSAEGAGFPVGVLALRLAGAFLADSGVFALGAVSALSVAAVFAALVLFAGAGDFAAVFALFFAVLLAVFALLPDDAFSAVPAAAFALLFAAVVLADCVSLPAPAALGAVFLGVEVRGFPADAGFSAPSTVSLPACGRFTVFFLVGLVAGEASLAAWSDDAWAFSDDWSVMASLSFLCAYRALA